MSHEHPQRQIRRSIRFMVLEESTLEFMGNSGHARQQERHEIALAARYPMETAYVPRALQHIGDPAQDIPLSQEVPPFADEPPLVTENPANNEDAIGLHFVAVRSHSEWTSAADIREVVKGTVEMAEGCARGWKMRFPLQNFGVFSLVSEIRDVAIPFETVKMQ